MFRLDFYNRRDLVWGEGSFVGGFRQPLRLLIHVDGIGWADDTCGGGGVGLVALGLGGQAGDLPGVRVHLEVGLKLGPGRSATEL